MSNIEIKRLILENFRNFSTKNLNFSEKIIAFCAQNGLGKTNILEALTVFGRNSNLRSADFDEMLLLNHENGQKQPKFSLFCEILGHDYIEKIGISFDKANKKTILINGEAQSGKKLNETKNYLPNFIWLTPQIELLFISGKTARREFLDRIVCDIDAEHNSRLKSYQKTLRERLLILQKPGDKNQEKWLKIVENKIAELGCAIVIARRDGVDFFNKAIASFKSNFPKSQLKIINDVLIDETDGNALKIEEIYQEKLLKNRQIDRESFKTHFGVHRSDFSATFLDKNSDAKYASTGEQKSIMIGITLARAKISAEFKNQPTILIFDEIMSHLDEKKKKNLLDEIQKSNLQCFFSVTDQSLIPQNDYKIQLIELKN